MCESEGRENKTEENSRKFKTEGKSRDFFLTEGIPLCFNSHNKINSSLHKKTTIVHNYWYFIMLICSGLSLDHLRVNFYE